MVTPDHETTLGALFFRARDTESFARVREALLRLTCIDPYGPGYAPIRQFGCYASFVLAPADWMVGDPEQVPRQALEAAHLAYAEGATWVSFASEVLDEVIARPNRVEPNGDSDISDWVQVALP